MTYRGVVSVGVLIAAVSLALSAVAAQAPVTPAKTTTAKKWTVPRTSWGEPDLQGIWNTATQTPMERPKALAGREFLTDKELAEREEQVKRRALDLRADRPPSRGTDPGAGPEHWYEYGLPTKRTSLIVEPADGRIPPLTAGALQFLEARDDARAGRGEADSWVDRNLRERCITYGGMPYAMAVTFPFNANKQILQTPGYVVIVIENIHDVRIIPLDGRPHVGARIRQYMGDSRGRWEGDTLVVDTTNIGKLDGGPISPSHEGGFHPGDGSSLHVVERFTRLDAGTIDYRYTIDDPTVYVRPYTVSMPMNRDASQQAIFEYACHEGNYGMTNMLTAARANEQGALDVANRELGQRRARRAGQAVPISAADDR